MFVSVFTENSLVRCAHEIQENWAMKNINDFILESWNKIVADVQ